MIHPVKLEIVCANIESVVAAQQGGADRVELCENLIEGGTTPSYGMIYEARKKLSIALNIMIRPRGGDFLYSGDEFEIMKHDIGNCKKLNADGVVFGILKADGSIDKNKTKELVGYAQPLQVTFHRAFDLTGDPFKALEDVIECGCNRILTSGQKATALDGAVMISELIKHSKGRIIIMPGGGVRSSNVAELISKTKATEVHSSAKMIRDSQMKFRNGDAKMGQQSARDFQISTVDVQSVRELKAATSSVK
jgi:copper homeostasis protein